FALVRQRGSNRRYSDLAVAAVEIRRVAAGIIAGLRRIVLCHFLLPGHYLLLFSSLFGLCAFRAIAMTGECGGNAQQIVSYRDIQSLTLIYNNFSAYLTNLSRGLSIDVLVLVMAASARRR